LHEVLVKVARRAVGFRMADLKVPLKAGDIVPCPKCTLKHFVQRDDRPGTRLDVETGITTMVENEALYVECPEAPGPIIVGMDGFALPRPLELTPRPKR
jgi:hypothetical protein